MDSRMNRCKNCVVCIGSKNGSYVWNLIDSINEGSLVIKMIVSFNDVLQFQNKVKVFHDEIVVCSANVIFLCQVIESLPRIQELTVSLIKEIGTKEAQMLEKSISNKGGILTRLKFDLEHCIIGFEGILSLSNGIISNAKSLRFLSLILKSIRVTDEMINTLGRAISQCNQLIELELDLKENFITLNAFEELCDSIETCSRIEALALNLNEPKNQSNSCIKIIRRLVHAFAIQLKSLKLNLKSSFYIQTSGIQDIFQSMKYCFKLEQLSLKLSVYADQYVSIPSIVKAIESYPYLTELRLQVSWETKQDEDILKWIIQAIDSRSLTLRILTLDLPSNYINPTQMKALLKSIHKCKSLIHLDLDTFSNRMKEFLRLSKSKLKKLKYLIKINTYFYNDYYEDYY